MCVYIHVCLCVYECVPMSMVYAGSSHTLAPDLSPLRHSGNRSNNTAGVNDVVFMMTMMKTGLGRALTSIIQ